MSKKSTDEVFLELMQENNMHGKIQEAQNAYLSTQEEKLKSSFSSTQNSSSSQNNKKTLGEKLQEKIAGPRIDEIDKAGSAFWKRFAFTAIVAAAIICGLVAISL